MVDLVDERLRRQNVAIAHRDPEKAELAARLRELEPDELDQRRLPPGRRRGARAAAEVNASGSGLGPYAGR
jgi:hypothetical protein